MNLEEATKIAEIAASADGYCDSCVSSLVEKLEESFPKFDWAKLTGEAHDRYFEEDEIDD